MAGEATPLGGDAQSNTGGASGPGAGPFGGARGRGSLWRFRPTPGRYLNGPSIIATGSKLRDVKTIPGSMLLTIVFAAAARIASLSATCRRLLRVPDEEAVAAALYAT